MKTKRVAMVLHSYYPIVGGAEKQLQAVIPYLRQSGIEPIILTRQYPGLSGFEEVDGVPVYRLPAPNPKPLAAISFIVFSLMKMWRIRPDIIHSYDLMSPTTIAIFGMWLLNIPAVAKVLSGGPRGDVDRIRNGLLGNFRLRLITSQIDRFVILSEEIASELDEFGGERDQYEFIPNGVDLEFYSPVTEIEKKEIRESLGLPTDASIVTYVGRLIQEKRLGNLLEAWKSIHLKFPNSLLVIIGSGNMAGELKAMSVEGVLFVGQVGNVRQYLQSSDIFILPSAREGLSNALLEAMACGIPSITTTTGAATDLLNDGENGILIPVDDINEIDSAVSRLLSDPGLRRKLGKAGRETVQRNYSLEDTAKNLSALYHELLAEYK